MPYRPDVIRYRSNGTILGKRPLGRKTIDAVTGATSYEAEMTYNQFGEYVDANGPGLDGPSWPVAPAIHQLGPQRTQE